MKLTVTKFTTDTIKVDRYCCTKMEEERHGLFLIAPKDGKPYVWMMHPFKSGEEIEIKFCPFCGEKI